MLTCAIRGFSALPSVVLVRCRARRMVLKLVFRNVNMHMVLHEYVSVFIQLEFSEILKACQKSNDRCHLDDSNLFEYFFKSFFIGKISIDNW